MANKTKPQTVAEAKALGIVFDEGMTQKDIQALIDAKAPGNTPEMETITIDEDYLAAHPELAAQGFTVGQTTEVVKAAPTPAAPAPVEEPVDALDESTKTAVPTNQFIVRQVAEGKFRLYNPLGQAASHIADNQEEIVKINKASARFNALRNANEGIKPVQA
ncbi:MAG: hypothetical protein V4478_03305 [Patescibacteria group bacterium]